MNDSPFRKFFDQKMTAVKQREEREEAERLHAQESRAKWRQQLAEDHQAILKLLSVFNPESILFQFYMEGFYGHPDYPDLRLQRAINGQSWAILKPQSSTPVDFSRKRIEFQSIVWILTLSHVEWERPGISWEFGAHDVIKGYARVIVELLPSGIYISNDRSTNELWVPPRNAVQSIVAPLTATKFSDLLIVNAEEALRDT